MVDGRTIHMNYPQVFRDSVTLDRKGCQGPGGQIKHTGGRKEIELEYNAHSMTASSRRMAVF